MVKNLFIFAAGAAIGSLVTWRILKSRETEWVEDCDEEFIGEDDYYDDEEEEDDEDDGFNYDFKPDKNEMKVMNETVKNLGYTEYSKKKKNKKSKNKDEDDDEIVPYVISPDDFGETGYETVSLTYYSDNVLADDYDEVVEDAELLIGNYALDRFGEYEEDIVHVRNDVNQTDYEICRVNEKFSDVDPSYEATEG